MSIRAKFLGFVDVIMRIPPLFLLDEILKMNLFESYSPTHFNAAKLITETLNNTYYNNPVSNLTDSGSSFDFYGISITLFKILVFLIGN